MSVGGDEEASLVLEEGDPSKQRHRCKVPAKAKCPNLGKLLAGIVAVVGPLAQKEPIAILLGGPTLYYTYVQATEAHKAGDGSKISEAVRDFLQPFQPKKPEEQVVTRDIMNTIRHLIKEWGLQTDKATIISGRHGATIAVTEALRGVRGVLQVSVQDASWREAMYKELGVGDYGMFQAGVASCGRGVAEDAEQSHELPHPTAGSPTQKPRRCIARFCRLAWVCKCQAHKVSNSVNNGRRRSDGDGVQHGEGFGNRCSRQCTNPRPTFCSSSIV